MKTTYYHLHIDAARLPESLLTWAIDEAGFHCDDFPHCFQIDGQEQMARHLTKYLYDPDPVVMKSFCHAIREEANSSNLLGFIQAEFVMNEEEWTGSKLELGRPYTPFQIKMRPLDPERGENFKKHELHLECEKLHTSGMIIESLMGCGFHVMETANFITFSCSGHPKELGQIRKKTSDFLKLHHTGLKGKMVYEATAFWSMHGMTSTHLPHIVESVI